MGRMSMGNCFRFPAAKGVIKANARRPAATILFAGVGIYWIRLPINLRSWSVFRLCRQRRLWYPYRPHRTLRISSNSCEVIPWGSGEYPSAEHCLCPSVSTHLSNSKSALFLAESPMLCGNTNQVKVAMG